jgi:hypothetical protein
MPKHQIKLKSSKTIVSTTCPSLLSIPLHQTQVRQASKSHGRRFDQSASASRDPGHESEWGETNFAWIFFLFKYKSNRVRQAFQNTKSPNNREIFLKNEWNCHPVTCWPVLRFVAHPLSQSNSCKPLDPVNNLVMVVIGQSLTWK